MVKTTNF